MASTKKVCAHNVARSENAPAHVTDDRRLPYENDRLTTVPFRSDPEGLRMLVFAAGYALAAYLLRPLWGVHKNTATPSWVLYSLAAAYAFYALLYWLVDVKKFISSRGVIALAGSNTLLMYMLHPMLYWVLALFCGDYFQTHINDGWTGVARAAVVAIGLFGLTALLTRCRVRLQL